MVSRVSAHLGSVMEAVAASQALRNVLSRVNQAAQRANRSPSLVTVVAVGKTKPVEMLKEVYDQGQRHFGENYVQEITEKCPQLPPDICWHFIGHLQTNKAKSLISQVPNLHVVETVDREKIADVLNKAVEVAQRPPLKIFVQVNTSGEESKYGIEPDKCVDLVKYIVSNCPNLKFSGLMTIGMPDYSSKPQNFLTLYNCKEKVSENLDIPLNDIELSMGMSGDFEQAIEMGSTNVRIGSTIFGARNYGTKT